MADSQLILDLWFLHIRGGCSLAVLLFFLMLVVAFKYVKRMLPLFRAVTNICIWKLKKTDSFQKLFIKMGCSVLKGDCLRALTFNLCFNTFTRYISDQKFKQFGFSTSSLLHIHFFQFADDTAITNGLENENQTLLNHLTRWCNWANMIIRDDKCLKFGIRKSSTASLQYLQKLFINQGTVQTVDIGKSFRYFGRYIN